MVPRSVLLAAVLVPLEIVAALLVAGLPSLLAAPKPQTYATSPGSAALTRTPTSSAAIASPLESTPTPTLVQPSPTSTSPEISPSPTPTDTPTPSPAATPTRTLVATPSPTTPSPSVTASATPLPSFVVAGTDGQGLNLRESPSTSSVRLRTIPEGGVVVKTGPSVSSEGAVWYPVRDALGASGWVEARYLAARPPA